jgi:hypothetical protein
LKAKRVAKWVRRIAIAHPRVGLLLSARIGYWGGDRLAARVLPSLDELSAVFGELEPRRAGRIRRELASHDHYNRTLKYLIRKRGIQSVLPLLRVQSEPLERLLSENIPVVVIGWHLGPYCHLMAGLHTLGRKALLAALKPNKVPEKIGRLEVRALEGGGLQAGFLRRAVEVLKTGGIVAMAVDGPLGASHSARYLDQPIQIGRGAASLARITGARLMPVTARWVGHSGRWEIRFHPALPEPQVDRKQADLFEAKLLDATVGWFDDFTRRNPGLVRLSWSNNPFELLRQNS